MYVCSTQQVKGRLQVKATEITPEASQCRHNKDEEGHQAHEINEGARGASVSLGEPCAAKRSPLLLAPWGVLEAARFYLI